MADTADRPDFGFSLLVRDGQARRGVVRTAWGDVDTPAFMPVGTAASVKATSTASKVTSKPADNKLKAPVNATTANK